MAFYPIPAVEEAGKKNITLSMRKFINTNWKTLLFFAVVGLFGGYFVGIYQLDSFPADMQQQIYDQGLTRMMLGLVSAIQSAGYGIVLGALGIMLAGRVGLWRNERSLSRKPLILTLIISIVGGAFMILSDFFFFGNYSPAILDSYSVKPTITYMIATVTYGAVIEEVMLRLFLMSLIAFTLFKIFERHKNKPSTGIFIVANIISATLFAAGHLPITNILLGITPMVVFRCFLLNGGLGLLFGYLYRKYGLRYSMIAHGGCHIVSKLIWILFL